MIMTILFILSCAWIGYRIFVEKKFLLWDWSDGRMGFMWNKDRDEG